MIFHKIQVASVESAFTEILFLTERLALETENRLVYEEDKEVLLKGLNSVVGTRWLVVSRFKEQSVLDWAAFQSAGKHTYPIFKQEDPLQLVYADKATRKLRFEVAKWKKGLDLAVDLAFYADERLPNLSQKHFTGAVVRKGIDLIARKRVEERVTRYRGVENPADPIQFTAAALVELPSTLDGVY